MTMIEMHAQGQFTVCVECRDSMGARILPAVVLVLELIQNADGLTCYMCPPTRGETAEEANIECLALGQEMSCAQDQDRCFRRFESSRGMVEMGCTRSTLCIGTTLCCGRSFCNADPKTSQTGYGRPCDDVGDCIQGGAEMTCAREVPSDSTKFCLCADDSFQRGSTCKRKSIPQGACLDTYQCIDPNSTCVRERCTCSYGLFANGSFCDPQTGLGGSCTVEWECRGSHTSCTAGTCTCQFGFLHVNGTDNCSGTRSSVLAQDTGLMVTVAVVSVMINFFQQQ